MADGVRELRVLGRLGEGGMGEVFLAQPVGEPGPMLALKRLLPRLRDEPAYVQMFVDEGRLGRWVRHPSLVEVIAVGSAGEDLCMVMELVDGPHVGDALNRSVERGAPPSVELAAFIVGEAARGLHAAHVATHPDSGEPLHLVHRDVSPHNVLVGFDGRVKITDFGVARAQTNLSKTKTGQLKGKLTYMAPEQCLGEAVDARTDVFCMGIVLHELLARQRLFTGATEFLVMRAIVFDPLPPPSAANPAVPAELDEITMRALTRDRQARWESAAALADALDAWLVRRGAGDQREALRKWLSQSLSDLQPTARVDRTDTVVHMSAEGDPTGGRSLPSYAPPAPDAWDPLAMTQTPVHLEAPTIARAALGQHQRTNVRPSVGSFVGREGELAWLLQRFDARARLVTLLGPGGVGKTRLARQFCELLAPQAESGGPEVWFCDLAAAVDAGDLAAVVATTLGMVIVQSDAENVVRIGDALAARGRTVVVLDNLEHLVEHAPAILEAWLGLAEDTCFVVTSRERMHIPGEELYELGPLAVPREEEESDGMKLFAQRAASALGGYEPSAAHRPIIAAIVRRLEGVPLAIELAASRMRVLSPQQILDRLQDHFELLKASPGPATGGRSSSGRHRTLRATLDWSWTLLDEDERRALMQCACFEGGFDIDAAEGVIELPSRDPLDALQALRDKSLLRWLTTTGTPRFALYEMIRAYARSELGDEDARGVYARHARYYGEVARGWHASMESGSDRASVIERVAHDSENLYAVLRRASREPSLAASAAWCVLALEPVARRAGSIPKLLAHADDVLPATAVDAFMASHAELAPRLLLVRGTMRATCGRTEEALVDLGHARAIAHHLANRALEARVHFELGNIRRVQGLLENAEEHHLRAVRLARESGAPRVEAAALIRLGNTYADRGDHARARASYQAALHSAHALGDVSLIADGLANLGIALLDAFDPAGAKRNTEHALALYRELRDPEWSGVCQGALGVIAYMEGHEAAAGVAFNAAAHGLLEVGFVRFGGLYLATAAAVEAKLGDLQVASVQLQRAKGLLTRAGDLPFVAAAFLLEAHLMIAHSRRAAAAGDHEQARMSRQAAEARATALPWVAGEGPTLEQMLSRSQAVRFAMTTVRRELALMPEV